MEVDYLIVGQGLAGSLLAWELIQRNKKVMIVDNNQLNASQVAAGLINPVTGMRFVKSADVDITLPFAIKYYQHLAQYFKQSFYVEKAMFRLLRNKKEQLACYQRLQDPTYQQYLGGIMSNNADITADFGILKQHLTGYLLTVPLLAALKSYFINLNAYIKAEIHYDEIKLVPSLHWKHISAKHIIFCEGHRAINNPWFSNLPFQLVKGEIITAMANHKIQQAILNYGRWFIPLDDLQFKTGASFDTDNINTTITHQAKNTLIDSLTQVYPALNIQHITNQQAGVRPTTLDKMPFVGRHPKQPNMLIFNGFGAKGSLQIPWHCQMLAEHLINNQTISSTSNVQRYNTLL